MNWKSYKHWLTIVGLPIAMVGINAFIQAFQASGGAFTNASLEQDAKVAAMALVAAVVGLVQPNKSQAAS